MAYRLVPWLARVGAVLGIASFFIPQFEFTWAPGAVLSPFRSSVRLHHSVDSESFVVETAMALLPMLGCLWILAASFSRLSRSSALRGAGIACLFVWSFALATLGSLTCTLPTSPEGGVADSSSGLLLFSVPLVLATVLLARVLGGSPSGATGTMVGGGLALLLLLWSFAVFQAPVVAAWAPGALVPMAAGALLSLASPRSPSPPPRAAAERA